MFLYNSDNPSEFAHWSNGFNLSVTSDDNMYFAGIDSSNHLIIAHGNKVIHNVSIGTSYNKYLKNCVLKFGEFSGVHYLAVSTKIYVNSTNIRNIETIYKLVGDTVTQTHHEDFNKHQNSISPQRWELACKIVDWGHGFSFLHTESTKHAIDPAHWITNWNINSTSKSSTGSFTINNWLSGNIGLTIHSWDNAGHFEGVRYYVKVYNSSNAIVFDHTYTHNQHLAIPSYSDAHKVVISYSALIGNHYTRHEEKECDSYADRKERAEASGTRIEGHGSSCHTHRTTHNDGPAFQNINLHGTHTGFITGANNININNFNASTLSFVVNSINVSNNSKVTTSVNDNLRHDTYNRYTRYQAFSNKCLKALHYSENDIYQGNTKSTIFTIDTIVNAEDKIGTVKNNNFIFSNAGSKNLSMSGVFSIDGNGHLHTYNEFQFFGISNGPTSLMSGCVFNSFSPNNYIINSYTIYDSVLHIAYHIVGDNINSYNKRTYTYNKTGSLAILNSSLNNFAPFTNFKITFNGYPGTPGTSNDHLVIKNILINNNTVYIMFFSNLNTDRIFFYEESKFNNRSNNSVSPEHDMAFALTLNNSNINNNIFNITNHGNNIFIAFNNNHILKGCQMHDYMYDLQNIKGFGTPSAVEMHGNSIRLVMDFTQKQYPLFKLIINAIVSKFDYETHQKFEALTIDKIDNYFKIQGNENLYQYNFFQHYIQLYDTKEIQSFFKGNTYTFNIEHRILSEQKKLTDDILFPLDPVTHLAVTDTYYTSSTFNFSSPSDNRNASFYLYLFDGNDTTKTITDSGFKLIEVNRDYAQQTSFPNNFQREKGTQIASKMDLMGLLPDTEYKILVIPYSSSYSLSDIQNKTYAEIKASNVIVNSELDFTTDYVPKLSIANTTKEANNLEINIQNYTADPYTKLKYSFYLKNKVWRPTTFEYNAYIDTDSIEKNTTGSDLDDLNAYYDVIDNKIILRNLFYDEEPIIVLNFEDTFKKTLLYNRHRDDLTGNDLYMPIPFTFGDLSDPLQNFAKQGIGYYIDNDTKPNYADFKTTEVYPSFISANYSVPNVNIGDHVDLKDGSILDITYRLEDIIYYRLYTMELPLVGETPIRDQYDPDYSGFKTFSIIKGSHDLSTLKGNYLDNGRTYSYFIEPILNLDRASDERYQMIWDLLRTPDTPALHHIRNDFTLLEFKYFPNTDFTIVNITDRSFELTFPDQTSIKALSNLNENLFSTLEFRTIVLNDADEEVYFSVYNAKQYASKTLKIDFLEESKDYRVFINITTNSINKEPLNPATAAETGALTTIPSPMESYNLSLDSATTNFTDEVVFTFTEKITSDLEFELEQLNLLDGTTSDIAIDTQVHTNNQWIITVKHATIKDLFANAYNFKIYKKHGTDKSSAINYVTALPNILTLADNVDLKEIKTTSASLDVKDLTSNKYNSYLNTDRFNVYNVDTDLIDSTFSWSSLALKYNSKLTIDHHFFGLKSHTEYKIKMKSRWDNLDLFTQHFNKLSENSRSFFPTIEYTLENPFGSHTTSDFTTLRGMIISPSFRRTSGSGSEDLIVWFNYTGDHVYIKVTNDSTGTVPDADIEVTKSTAIRPYTTTLVNVSTDPFNIIFKVYSDSAMTTEITNDIEISPFDSVKGIERINVTITEQRQVLNLHGTYDNKFFFKGFCMPVEANFDMKSTGLDKGLSSNLNYTLYTEPRTNDKGIQEDVKIVEFTLDNLGFGVEYSTGTVNSLGGDDYVRVFAKSSNSAAFLDSYPALLSKFVCKYPLLRAPSRLEPELVIKDKVEFKFATVEDAYNYSYKIYYRPSGSADFEDAPVYEDTVSSFTSEDYILVAPLLIEPKAGIYKLVVTTLNIENEPSGVEDLDYSTTSFSINYLNQSVIVPELKTLANTSDIRPIFSFDNPIDQLLDSQRPDYLVMTNDSNLGTADNQNTAYGWFQFNVLQFNIFSFPNSLVSGLNTFYYKTYNKKLGMFSEVKTIDVYYDENIPTSFLPNTIYSNTFYGIGKDGATDAFKDPNRILTINENFNIKKISYIITNEAGKEVSEDVRGIFEVKDENRLEDFYVYIDQYGDILPDGNYFVNVMAYDIYNQDRHLIKTVSMIINNKTLPMPKIKYESQNII